MSAFTGLFGVFIDLFKQFFEAFASILGGILPLN